MKNKILIVLISLSYLFTVAHAQKFQKIPTATIDNNGSTFSEFLTVFNGKLYFPGMDSTGAGLMTSDGTTLGTLFIAQNAALPTVGFTYPNINYAGKLFFEAHTWPPPLTSSGDQLWVTDGSPGGNPNDKKCRF